MTSLMEALEDLGELMADNLVTMGVTYADASDGLTTLVDKILDVPVTPVASTLTLTSDKPVLSYYDSDTLTLTATLTGGSVSGKTIEFFKGNTSIGTAQTDSNGIATKSYSATGVGDVVFSATGNNLTSQLITVEDCKFYNSGDKVSNLEIGSNVSCTSNGSYITITTSTSGEKYVKLPVTLANDWQYEVEVAETGSNQDLTFIIDIGGCWGAIPHNGSNMSITLTGGSSVNYPFSGSIVGGKLKITCISNTITVYFNNTLLVSRYREVSGYKMGFYTNNGRVQKVKNIKLKAL